MTFKGHKHTEKSKQKMSLSRKGNQNRKGILHSELDKRRISKGLKKAIKEGRMATWNKGKKCPELGIANIDNIYMLGKKHSAKTKRKLSLAKIGKKHPCFNGWSSRIPYGRRWSPKLREDICRRDNFYCWYPSCKKEHEKANVVHHIDYNKKNCNPKNLICLHHGCHSKTISLRGREFHQKYFENVQMIRGIK